MNKILSAINSILPKRKIIIFNSFPDVSGNSLALYEYILKNRKDLADTYKLVWTIGESTKENVIEILRDKTKVNKHCVVKKKSAYGIWLYFSAKYIISTHGYFPKIRTAKNQTHINLWHGMPFKRIGYMLKEVHTNGAVADITIATSEIFKNIMAKSFGIEESKVIVTGQPCNDVLLHKNNVLKRFGVKKDQYKKIIMWMPTYRKSVVGDIRQDGKSDGFGVAEIMQNHFEELNSSLKSNGYLLLIKPHPMDAICKMEFKSTENIKVLLNEQLAEKKVQLYELLSDCDVLLTDYSSVFIDFLITGKPMAFVCDDLAEYSDTRGFCFENPRDYMPGELIKDYDSLIYYLNNMDALNENWSERYAAVQKEFNPFCDSNASERVCRQLWG